MITITDRPAIDPRADQPVTGFRFLGPRLDGEPYRVPGEEQTGRHRQVLALEMPQIRNVIVEGGRILIQTATLDLSLPEEVLDWALLAAEGED